MPISQGTKEEKALVMAEFYRANEEGEAQVKNGDADIAKKLGLPMSFVSFAISQELKNKYTVHDWTNNEIHDILASVKRNNFDLTNLSKKVNKPECSVTKVLSHLNYLATEGAEGFKIPLSFEQTSAIKRFITINGLKALYNE